MSRPVPIGKIADVAKEMQKRVRAGIERGARNGARRGRAILTLRTPKDTGHLKASWRENDGAAGTGYKSVLATVLNSAPHAGIVERGARPHAVSEAGQEALYQWARRHFPGETEGELRAIVRGIVWKLRTKGQRPTYFIRDSLPDLNQGLAEEVLRELRKLESAPPTGGGK